MEFHLHGIFGTWKFVSITEGKNVFKYTLAGGHVCRDFFTFVYCATKGTIDRLQSCINTNKPFNQDWGGHHRVNEHLMLAKTARLAYSDHRLMTAKEDGKVVLSFDYAENILLPILSETPAQFYFKKRRKVELFGIANECTNAQVNFLVDECDSIGKGLNSTISMLDHYIHSYVQPLSSLVLYSDNCPGQNKNAHMIGYLSYLTKFLKRHPRIEYYFMLSGHTKFSPDGNFGSIKRKLKMEVCQGITDLLGSTGVVSRSAKKTSHLFIRTLLLKRLTLNGGIGKNTLAQNFYPVQVSVTGML